MQIHGFISLPEFSIRNKTQEVTVNIFNILKFWKKTVETIPQNRIFTKTKWMLFMVASEGNASLKMFTFYLYTYAAIKLCRYQLRRLKGTSNKFDYSEP